MNDSTWRFWSRKLVTCDDNVFSLISPAPGFWQMWKVKIRGWLVEDIAVSQVYTYIAWKSNPNHHFLNVPWFRNHHFWVRVYHHPTGSTIFENGSNDFQGIFLKIISHVKVAQICKKHIPPVASPIFTLNQWLVHRIGISSCTQDQKPYPIFYEKMREITRDPTLLSRSRWWFQSFFEFSSLLGEMIQFE